MSSDGDLSKLNPIITPEPVGWLPLAPGWQLLLLLGGLLLLWLAWRWWLRWRRECYRREALRAFKRIDQPAALADLLKRTALSAFDRRAIAALSGPAWHRFLDDSAGMSCFSGRCGEWLDAAAYRSTPLEQAQWQELRQACAGWLRRHRVEKVRAGAET